MPHWMESLCDLVIGRVELMRIEARQALADGVIRLAMAVAAIFLSVVVWLLLLAAVAGLAHAHAGLAWYWSCLVLAGLHLLAILAMIRRTRAPRPPAFQHTRSEFQKDREWLHNLQHRKSKH